MRKRYLILACLGRFALVYTLLILPWPGFKEGYGSYFRGLANAVFAEESPKRVVLFRPNDDKGSPPNFDTLITIANPALLEQPVNRRWIILGLGTRQLCWIPTAFLLALIVATPMSWKRRLRILLFGLFGIHCFILLSMWIYIWNESTLLSLATLTPFWKQVAESVEKLVIAPMGLTFFVPVLIWILLTFRRHDDVFRIMGVFTQPLSGKERTTKNPANQEPRLQ